MSNLIILLIICFIACSLMLAFIYDAKKPWKKIVWSILLLVAALFFAATAIAMKHIAEYFFETHGKMGVTDQANIKLVFTFVSGVFTLLFGSVAANTLSSELLTSPNKRAPAAFPAAPANIEQKLNSLHSKQDALEGKIKWMLVTNIVLVGSGIVLAVYFSTQGGV